MWSTSRLLALLVLASGSALYGGQIDAIYAFGDSLSDVGNAYIAAGVPGAPYVNHQFSNGNVWIQDLALDLGLPELLPSLTTGGTDYAVGSAQSGTTVFNTAGAADLPAQISAFRVAHPNADPNALYTIWIGSNDISAIPGTATSGQIQTDLTDIATNIDSAIGTLASEGAKNFLIVDVPDLGKTPASIALGASAAESALSGGFDSAYLIPSLASIPGADSLHLSVLDAYSLIDTIVANPASYGFSDVTDPCLTGVNYTTYSGGTVCGTPNGYLFWDQEHPTAAANVLVANAALAVVTPEPLSLALGAVGILGLFIARRWLSWLGHAA